ncbi:hypothetical protein Aple_086580 [Acrocarpospora pleiomorpha]|uniref:Uncharacterized protein n=1 Tax=Acrocarpospora pleiomorpha TaxID=90975 RepID=A0A5M3Y0S2_9ACTN|nr:hypothetical protein Aple_086580 [Acrocarpospora pleiomorpha]
MLPGEESLLPPPHAAMVKARRPAATNATNCLRLNTCFIWDLSVHGVLGVTVRVKVGKRFCRAGSCPTEREPVSASWTGRSVRDARPEVPLTGNRRSPKPSGWEPAKPGGERRRADQTSRLMI